MPSLRHEQAPSSALVVAAHPDDIEFMAGGTLATWIAQGTSVHYLLVTDGASGSRDPQQTPEVLAARRRSEQCAAADLLGVTSVTFLGYSDAELEPSLALRIAIARVIRQVRPEVVLTFDPQRHYSTNGINHTDHLVVGASTLGAVMPLANTRLAARTLLEEGLEPHDVRAVYLFDPATPTDWMPLARRELEQKASALQAHASQLTLWDGVAAAYTHARDTAQAANRAGVSCAYAEAFVRIQLGAHAPQPQPARRRALVPAVAGIAQVARSVQLAFTSLVALRRIR